MSVKTWVLVEPSGAIPGGVQAAISHPGIEGVAFAQPWDLIETAPGVYDFSKVDAIAAIAVAAGKKMSLRIRGGAHTPSWAMGRTWVPTSGQAVGVTIPNPCETTGVPNATFVNAFTNLFNFAASWCLTNNVGFLHFTWFGGLSAELYETDELLTLTGCSSANVRSAHFALLHMAEGLSSAITIEFPASGFTVPSSGLRGAIATEMSAHNRPQYLQENNLDDGTWHVWPYSFKPHGNQMVHAQPPSPRTDEWDWNAVYFNEVSTLSDYVEIQFDCFNTNVNKAQLYAAALANAPTASVTGFPATVDVLVPPVPNTRLHTVGKTPADLMKQMNDAVEAVETVALVRTSPDVVVPTAYAALPEILINDAEVITGWAAAGGATMTVDATTFTHGSHSIQSGRIKSGSLDVFGKAYYNLPAPMDITGYATLSFDLQWNHQGTVPLATAYQAVIADGASLTGNVIVQHLSAVAESQWFTVNLSTVGLTSIRSIGVQAWKAGFSGSNSGLLWSFDYVRLDAQTQLETAMFEGSGVVIPPSHPSQFGAQTSYPDKTALDLRPTSTLLQRHSGTRHVDEWSVCDDGTQDVSALLSQIIVSLAPRSTLLFNPDGQYLVNGFVNIAGTGITIDGQGCTWFTTRDRSGRDAGGQPIEDHFVYVSSDHVTIRNLNVIGWRRTSYISFVSAGAPTPPTTSGWHLNVIGDEIVSDPLKVYYLGREKDGLMTIDVGIISQTVPATVGDCLIRMVDAVSGQEMARMFPPLTSTFQPFTISVDGSQWLGSQPRIYISKATNAANVIYANGGGTLHNIVDYRADHDQAAGFNIQTGHDITIEDCRIEGVNTDAISSSQNEMDGLIIRRCQSIACSRQGMSVSRGRNILIEDCVIRECGRTGIDFEPYTPTWAVWHCTVRGCTFINSNSHAISNNQAERLWYFHIEDCVSYNAGLGFLAGGCHHGVYRNIRVFDGPDSIGRGFGTIFTGRNCVLDHITCDGTINIVGMGITTYDASTTPSADLEIQALGPVTYPNGGNMASNITVYTGDNNSAIVGGGTTLFDPGTDDDRVSLNSGPYNGPFRLGAEQFSALGVGKFGDLLPDTFKGMGFSTVWQPGGTNLRAEPVSNARAVGTTLVKGNNLSKIGVPIATGASGATINFAPHALTNLAVSAQPAGTSGGTLAAGTYYVAVGTQDIYGGPKLATAYTAVALNGTTTNAIRLIFTTGWEAATRMIPGFTWFRAGPAASFPGTYSVRYPWIPSAKFYGVRRVLGMEFHDNGTALVRIPASGETTGIDVYGYPLSVAPVAGSFTLADETGWEPDTNYGVMVETSWATVHSVSAKRTSGFDLTFATPAPAGATISWMLVRG